MTKAPARFRRLIYLDTAYTLRIVREKQHEDYWLARHNAGYFSRVWGVHPMADVADGPKTSPKRIQRFSARQISLEWLSRPWRLPKGLMPLEFIAGQVQLLRTLVAHARRWPVDAVFSNDPLYCGLLGHRLARRLGVPFVVFVPAHYDELWEHARVLGSPRLLRFRKVEQAVMRYVFSRADMVVAVADSVDAMARRYGARPEAIARLAHGKYLSTVHLQEPAERPQAGPVFRRLGVPEASEYLIYVGRMTAVKHPEDALRAMAEVLRERPDAVGIMAGDGDMRASLMAEASALGLDDRIIFPGAVDQPSLAAILPHCVALSPLTGMALIEVALAGAPVVAYDRDWQAEFVRDGETGFVVPYGDVAALAGGARKILSSPDLRRRMAERQREKGVAFVDVEGNRLKEWAAWDALFQRFSRGGKRTRTPPRPSLVAASGASSGSSA